MKIHDAERLEDLSQWAITTAVNLLPLTTISAAHVGTRSTVILALAKQMLDTHNTLTLELQEKHRSELLKDPTP